jgi:ribonuclease HI
MARFNWHSYDVCHRPCSNGDRLFLPGAFFARGEHDVEIPDRDLNLVRCSHGSAHTDGIVLAVDGACSRNGMPGAAAGVGVYVAPRSRYNVASPLATTGPILTNQIAELVAGIAALKIARDLVEGRSAHIYGGKIVRQIVVKSDSQYLVNGMTAWIFKWRNNGFTNARGGCVRNGRYFLQLDDLVQRLESKGVEVLF